jgi:hypothetical protein
MTVDEAIELISDFAQAEMEATKRGKSTVWERRAAKALLKAMAPSATTKDLERLLLSFN